MIKDNNITEERAKIIAEALKPNTSVTELSLKSDQTCL